MIISHKHRFIFVKTKKTAGTSLEIALSGICGPRDVLTPVSTKDEHTRKRLGYRGAQNYRTSEYTFLNHTKATKIRDIVGPDVWNSYFKFAFERNPWDKVVSWFYWHKHMDNALTLEAFFESQRFSDVGDSGGFNLYSEDGEIILDHIYQFEQIEHATADLARRFGLTSLPPLPRAKSEFRNDRRPFKEIFNKQQKEAIERAFCKEIALFGYRFE